MSRFLRGAAAAAVCAVGLLCEAAPGRAQAPGGPARVDTLGDPLPEGVVARLGTVRFRHGDRVNGLAFLTNGPTLVSSSDDGTLRFWSLATGREQISLPVPQPARLFDVTFSADGERLLACGEVKGEGAVMEWKAE